jgi:hypothetical protein
MRIDRVSYISYNAYIGAVDTDLSAPSASGIVIAFDEAPIKGDDVITAAENPTVSHGWFFLYPSTKIRPGAATPGRMLGTDRIGCPLLPTVSIIQSTAYPVNRISVAG